MKRRRELYAVIGDYAFLAEQIDNRREELGIGVDDLDSRADLAEHFASKACGPSQSAKWGLATPAGKSNGAGKPGSLFRVLEALGLRLALIEDVKLTRAALDGTKRQDKHVRTRNYARRASIRVFKRVQHELAKAGGKARWDGKSKAERSEHARDMALIRWADVKAAAAPAATERQSAESVPRPRSAGTGAAKARGPRPSPSQPA